MLKINFNRLFGIFVAVISLIFIGKTFQGYFFLKLLSVEKFFVIQLFFFICLLGSIFFFFGIGSYRNIINVSLKNKNTILDIILLIIGLVFWIACLYVTLFWITGLVIRNALIWINGILILLTFVALCVTIVQKKFQKGL